MQNSITSGALTMLAAIAILASPSVLAAQLAGTNDIYVQVGAAGLIHRVSRVHGGSSSGVVELGAPDADDGVVRKQLSPDRTSEDFEVFLDVGKISNVILELTDAFIDGRRITMDVIYTSPGSTSETGRWRLTDAQVLSVTARAATLRNIGYVFAVTMRARSFLRVKTEGRAIVAAEAPWYASDVRLSLDGVRLPGAAVDSVELRGNWIKGEAGTGFTHPDLRVSTSVRASSFVDSLAVWYDRETAVGRSARQQERSLSVEFLSLTGLPTPLRLEARGVGMVAMRSSLNTGRLGVLEAELYVEEWDRAGRIPKPAPAPLGPPLSSNDPPATSGARGENEGSSPSDGKGSFRVNLPTAVFTGTGSMCTLAGNTSAFIIQLNGPGGIGIIGATGVRLGVGTFAVAAEGDGNVHLGFSQSGEKAIAYTAKSGTFSFTKLGDSVSGSFRVVADVTDASNEAKEATITGSFKNIPTSC